jgi:mannose-6-phosphate isomerase
MSCGLYRMDNAVMPYAWGSPTFLPQLQQRLASGQPEAELWMGAHSKAPSRLENDTLLGTHVERAPAQVLGPAAAKRFGNRLPFLLKVLAAEQVLSLQVHPTLSQAQSGFAEENAQNIPLNSPRRLYADDSDKPELVCALTPFEALCGFRDAHQQYALLRAHGLNELAAELQRQGVKKTIRTLLQSAPHQREEWIADALKAHGPEHALLQTLTAAHPTDAGVLVALMLNHLVLAPGDALFLPAGKFHAYVRGAAVEIMASSDNVIRGGLTVKPVAIEALLDTVAFEAEVPVLLRGSGVTEKVFETSTAAFRLSRIDLQAVHSVTRTGPDILLVTQGGCEVRAQSGVCALRQGQSLFADFSAGALTLTGSATVFRATTP